MSTLQQLSVIIPFAPDDMAWKELLLDLNSLPSSAEIILVAGSEKAKLIAQDFSLPANVTVICTAMGRGLQMNDGAKNAKNPCLWFLHADSRIDARCLKVLDAFDYKKKQLGYFGLHFQDDGPRRMHINSVGVWFRSRFLGIPFGDQGFVISKSYFEMLGAFREDLGSGEDHAFVWMARKNGVPLKHLKGRIQTSARKYAQHGWGKTTRMHLRETWKQARQFSMQGKKRANGGLAIFVKTPGLSPLKTRLAAGMGAADSERWYLLAVEAVKSVAKEAQGKTGIKAYWAVAEPEAMHNNQWQSLPGLAQTDYAQAGLGERMGCVIRTLIHQHGFGILIGADAPQICSEDIQNAIRFLDHADPRLVLGPARDGGFWCVGSNHEFPIELWQSVAYSQANTYRDFVAVFSPFAEILNLRTLSDVDEAGDLAICNRELERLEHATPEQLTLHEAFSRTELPA